MKATNDKKIDLAKEILLAYMAHSPENARDLDSVLEAARKIFNTVDSMLETGEQPKEAAGFRL